MGAVNHPLAAQRKALTAVELCQRPGHRVSSWLDGGQGILSSAMHNDLGVMWLEVHGVLLRINYSCELLNRGDLC
jgi:hypothetical protein